MYGTYYRLRYAQTHACIAGFSVKQIFFRLSNLMNLALLMTVILNYSGRNMYKNITFSACGKLN